MVYHSRVQIIYWYMYINTEITYIVKTMIMSIICLRVGDMFFTLFQYKLGVSRADQRTAVNDK